MIKSLIRFGKWLESRFPEKLVVTREGYEFVCKELGQARAEVDILRADLAELKQSHTATIDRVGRVESSAVHKGAVQDLVVVVQAVKDEITALKANLGWSRPNPEATSELQAVLNGEIIHG